MTFRFADCVLDTDTRTLTRAGRAAHLSPKAFSLLTLLVDNRPRVLTKEELVERVWQGVFVSDASLAKAVSKIRQAIGQEDDSRIVRTVHGCGYAFAADVVSEPPAVAPIRSAGAAVCWLFCGRREFPLEDGQQIVGRDADADIRLDSPQVSRRHAKVLVSGTRADLVDLESKNGSYVRGRRISRPTPLQPGDDIRIGPFALIFRLAESGGSTETEMR